jgi:REP element-mobilizing transposase RayT
MLKSMKRPRRPRSRRRQLDLTLPLRGRGGAGRGQGRKKLRHDYVPHITRPFLDRNHPVHVSTRVLPGLPSLRGGRLWHAVRRALVLSCARERFRIVHFSVQGQHIHILCEASDRRALSAGVKGFKVSVARRANAALGRKGTVFRDRFHQRIITTPTQCRHTLAYVLNNQRHHAYEERASYPRGWLDPHSSARYFDGWLGRPAPPPDGDDAPVAAARSWMLRVGWRRGGGPISADHIPALPPGAPPLPVWSA